ncbi:MAG: hypothetical protein ACTSX9_03450 [Candidatus Njordarchaeales archaeon]
MKELGERLERVYKLVQWADDPYTQAGKKRFETYVTLFKGFVEHEWLSKLLERKVLRIVDICGSTGIGGIALAKVLSEYTTVKLCILDLRRGALDIARRFSKEMLGSEAETIVHDVRKIHELGKEWDIGLMTGYSMTHFNPWEAIKIFSGIAASLSNDGLCFFEEVDRIYHVFLRMGYKRILPERMDDGSVTISIHKRYDVITGSMERVYIDLVTRNFEGLKTYYWSLSELMALLWIFFKEIDFVATASPYYGFIIVKEPRRIVTPEMFLEEPQVLKKNER